MAFSKRARLPVGDFIRRKAPVRRVRGFAVRQFPPEFAYSRAGVVVGRAAAKKAVERNRIRRTVSRALAAIFPLLSAPSDILIIIEPAAVHCDYEETYNALIKLLISSPRS